MQLRGRESAGARAYLQTSQSITPTGEVRSPC